MLETIQYRARPASKFRVNTPNMPGMSQSIMRFVDSCCGVVEGMVVIFCMTNMETPTSTGRRKGMGLALEYSARLSQRKLPSRGTASWTMGRNEYRWPDRSASLSGVDGRVPRSAQKRPRKMGIWTTRGPRQPTGFMPCSR